MKTVLVVEDEPRILRMIRFNLERAGYHVLIATDTVSALTQARLHPPALVVMDMPLIFRDGADSAAPDFTDCGAQHAPLIVLVPSPLEYEMLSGWDGIDVAAWLAKPFNPMLLRAIVRRLLGDLEPKKTTALEERFWPEWR